MSNVTAVNADVVAGVTVAIVATLGMVVNSIGAVIVGHNPVLASNFGQLCMNHCISNFAICCISVCWVAPMTIFQLESLSTSVLGKVPGIAVAPFWAVFFFSHVAVSVDRFIAIRFPLKKHLRNRKSAIIMNAIIWSMAFCQMVPYFFVDSFSYVYHPATWQWSYSGDLEWVRIMTLINMVKTLTSLGCMTLFDLTTLYFLRKHHKYTHRLTMVSTDTPSTEVEIRCRHAEIRFFIQAIVQGLIFVFHQVNILILRKLTNTRWTLFACTTMTIVVAHTMDGLVLCIFQLNGYVEQRKISRVKNSRAAATTS